MKTIAAFILFCVVIQAKAQTIFKIGGTFANAKQKDIRLMGFVGTKDTLLCQTTIDTLGNFMLQYPKKYSGAATIQVKESANLVVLLNQENFTIVWNDFKDFNSVRFTNTIENELFQKGYAINLDVQKKLAGLNYLLPLYKKEVSKKEWSEKLENEIVFENNRIEEFLKKSPSTSYVKKYSKYRTLLQKFQSENKTKVEEIDVENAFLSLDFNDVTLYHSGLTKDFFDFYLQQLLKLQKVEAILKKAAIFSDILKSRTVNNPIILNEYSEYLIKQYEKYGLTEAAKYFSLSLLEDNKCIVDSKRLPLLEQYQKMAIGKQAPKLVFTSNNEFQTLSDSKSKYKIIVFGASWCEECKKEIPQFKEYAEIFRTKYDAEIIFISLDTDKERYTNFTKDLPFINNCDFKGWEGENVKSYYVFATPSIFIVDDKNTIAAKPLDAINTASWLYNNFK